MASSTTTTTRSLTLPHPRNDIDNGDDDEGYDVDDDRILEHSNNKRIQSQEHLLLRRQEQQQQQHQKQQQKQKQQQQQQQQSAPTYEERCRSASEISKISSSEERRRRTKKLFIPRSLHDFDDGGAFPEIHVAQYPRHMGNPHVKKKNKGIIVKSDPNKGDGGDHLQAVARTSRSIVNVQVDKDGQVSYDAIVKGGTNADKLVYTRHEDMRGIGTAKPEDVALPTQEEEDAEAERTNAALQALLASKTALDKPSGSAIANAETSKNIESKTQFIQYTPNPDAPGYNPAAAKRVIQMVPAKVDPLMPPKHKHIKAPRGPREDPVPVLHAPPTKLTKEEKAAWNVPACISNWKNMRGYTIPLDKRLAADGRGLLEPPTINPNFATLSESLYVAERQARQEVRMRAQVQKKLAMAEKEKREEELRELANRARLERGGAPTTTSTTTTTLADHNHNQRKPSGRPSRNDSDDDDDDDDSVSDSEDDDASRGGGRRRRSSNGDDDDRGETEDEIAARQRERLRIERKRERERELRLEKNMEWKKRKLEQERDVSEKIALGMQHPTAGAASLSGGIDSRLYNQSAGMDSGFGADDEYNAYSKPLFGSGAAATAGASIYRPTRGETEYNADEQYEKLVQGATTKFHPDKGFAGAESGGMDLRGAGPRTAPVQFERSSNNNKN